MSLTPEQNLNPNPTMQPEPRHPRFRAALYPHGGWRVRLPDGSFISAGTRDELDSKVRHALNSTPQEAIDFVDDRLCEMYPSNCDGGRATESTGHNLADRIVTHLLRMENRAAEHQPQEKVEARLAICKRCPRFYGHTTPGCCGSPDKIEALVKSVADAKGVKHPFSAGWCGTTGLNIKLAAVLAPDGLINPVDVVYETLPSFCPYRYR